MRNVIAAIVVVRPPFRPSRFLSGLLVIVAMAAGSAGAAPTIRFESRAIVVEHVTRGGTLRWFGIAHEPQAYHVRVREYAGASDDADRDGVVRIDLPRDVSPESLWVAVDTTTGQWSTAQPATAEIRSKPLPPARFRRGTAGRASIAGDEEYLKFWVVRTSRGSWVHTAEDGGRGDSDGVADGVTTAALSEFEPVAGSPDPPAELQRGDIVVVVDPWQLRIFETSIRDEDVQP